MRRQFHVSPRQVWALRVQQTDSREVSVCARADSSATATSDIGPTAGSQTGFPGLLLACLSHFEPCLGRQEPPRPCPLACVSARVVGFCSALLHRYRIKFPHCHPREMAIPQDSSRIPEVKKKVYTHIYFGANDLHFEQGMLQSNPHVSNSQKKKKEFDISCNLI